MKAFNNKILLVLVSMASCYAGSNSSDTDGTTSTGTTYATTGINTDTSLTSAPTTFPSTSTPVSETGIENVCGDLLCGPGEDCTACPDDCPCAACGDGMCADGEDCSICPGDCGACTTCPDGACAPEENCTVCPQDCGECPPSCPNAACDNGEDCNTCPQDCGACPVPCPNGACDNGEDCNSCPQDCGVCPTCPNGACDNGETCDSCAQDCGACPGFPPGGAPDPNCIGDEGSGGMTCGGLGDAWTKSAVNIGYYPFKIKPGVNTNLYTCDNRPIEALGPGQGFAAQSTRNPGCIENPPLRPALNGFVFGYARGSAKSGWVPADALEFAGYDGGSCADGPASADFQVLHNPYDGCKAMACDGQLGCMAVNGANDGANDCGGSGKNEDRTVAVDDLYLRYAPQSTAYHYLHNNDKVHVLYANAGGQWLFVEVTGTTCPALTPNGTRGWVLNMGNYWK